MAYPGPRTFPSARTFPGVVTYPYVVDASPPAATVDDLFAGSRRLLRRVTVLRAGEAVAELPCSGGSITVRDGLPTWELSSLAVHGDQWVPRSERDALHPEAGNELRIEVGLSHRDVGELWWPLGVYDLSSGSVDLGDDGSGVAVSISAPDRSTRVSRALMRAPVRVEAGRPTEMAVADLLAGMGGRLPVEYVGAGGILTTSATFGEPGKDVLQVIADALTGPKAVDLRVGPDGTARLVPVSDPETQPPRWTWRVGDDPIFSTKRTLKSRTKAVIVPWQAVESTGAEGEPAVPPPSGVEVVPDEHSTPRAWWPGDASIITSPEQARSAGVAWLAKEQASADLPSLRVLLDPRVQVGDIARVEHDQLGIEVAGRIVGLAIDLDGDVMDVTLAGRRMED